MAVNNEIISKGVYEHQQANGFISVKQYIFFRHADKKHLLLRLSNDMDVGIDSVAITVTQLDSDGRVIATSSVTEKTNIKARAIFSPTQALVVKENCVGFRLTVDKAVSGDYAYSVINGELVVRYEDEPLRRGRSNHVRLTSNEKVNEKKRKNKMAALGVLALILVIAINVLWAFAPEIGKALFGENDRSSRNTESNGDSYYEYVYEI